jgi:hypothetical protein
VLDSLCFWIISSLLPPTMLHCNIHGANQSFTKGLLIQCWW